MLLIPGQKPLPQLSDFVFCLDNVSGGTAPTGRQPDICDGIGYYVFYASAGAGLSQGEKLTKLLAERVDKAMLVYRKDPTPPYLISSGGRGDDEKISEAEAMKM
ncbi:MAG: YdcF family protein [Lachnospiraceae bacterium]|nr:YdcF family protein [Lachnospiraceae bacterium]